jgi:hypothetical protein
MMHRFHPADIVGIVLTVFSWILIAILVFGFVRALVTGDGWIYLD